MDIHLNCPIPFTDSDRVLLAHGGGGRMTHQLISQVFYPAFRNPLLEQDHDGCVFLMEEGRLAYSTDSFVVDPIFFPGGATIPTDCPLKRAKPTMIFLA